MEPLASFLEVRKPKKSGSERAELVKYFVDRARDREGKPYKASYIAFRLSHLSMQDLYYLRSSLEDRAKTFRPYEWHGKTVTFFNWNAAFFAALKPKEA